MIVNELAYDVAAGLERDNKDSAHTFPDSSLQDALELAAMPFSDALREA